MALEFLYGRLSFEEVMNFLQETDFEYPIPLSTRVNIEDYAKKLSDLSDFSICKDGNVIVGMISCYTNQPPLGYISNVCIKKDYQGKKLFSVLFQLLLNNIKDKGIHILRLMVDFNNLNAQTIYLHFGFLPVEKNSYSRKLLMELKI